MRDDDANDRDACMRLGYCVSCVAVRRFSSIRLLLLVRLVSAISGLVCDPSSRSE